MKAAKTPQAPARSKDAAAGADELTAASARDLVTRHWGHVKAGLVVILIVVVLGAVVAAVQSSRHRRIGQAFAELKKADTREALDAICQERQGSTVGELASMRIARQLYEEKNYEQAASRFALFCRQYPESPAVAMAKLGEAHALEAAGKAREAAQCFAELVVSGGDPGLVVDAMCGAARSAAAQGQLAEAESWYNKALSAAGTEAWQKDGIQRALDEITARRVAGAVPAAEASSPPPSISAPAAADGAAATPPDASAK